MALRMIRVLGDPILEKECKPVKAVNGRTKELIQDMFDTMYDANGVGIAAPQVGVLKRIFVIDAGEEDGGAYVCINPEVTPIGEETQLEDEACLSVPGKAGKVQRHMRIHLRAFDENMQEYELDAEGILARAIEHENDHLSGIIYTEKVEGELQDVDYEEEDYD